VVVPVREMRDHDLPTLDIVISRIHPGGSTDLSAGYLLGLRELKRSLRSGEHTGGTVLLVSDGHANAGITDAVQMRDLAATGQNEHRVTTSTLGFGEGYDEVLLEAMTRGGNGTHAFAPDVDAATKEIEGVVSDLLDKSVIAALMRIRPQVGLVEHVQVIQDLPHWSEGDAIVVNLGDMYAGEERKTLFALHVPAITALGTATIADVVFEYTTLPDLKEHEVTIPIAVNVVPGDEARNRVPNPIVDVEHLLVEIDSRKKDVSASLRHGDISSAQRTLAGAIRDLDGKREQVRRSSNDSSLHLRLEEAAKDLLALADDVRNQDANIASKSVMNSYASTSRGRNQRNRLPSPTEDDES
jgi:Ca-activated chloride channel homolog